MNGNAPIITCLLYRAYNGDLRIVRLTDIHLNFVPDSRRRGRVFEVT